MQLVLQRKQVGIGANELNHSATDFSGKSLDLRHHDASARRPLREMTGGGGRSRSSNDNGTQDKDGPYSV